jgi:hypothetical protein
MPWVGFQPTIPVFEREKTVHALDRAATVIDTKVLLKTEYNSSISLASIRQKHFINKDVTTSDTPRNCDRRWKLSVRRLQPGLYSSPSNTTESSAPALNRQLAFQNGTKAGESDASLWVQLIENSDVTATWHFRQTPSNYTYRQHTSHAVPVGRPATNKIVICKHTKKQKRNNF